MRHSAQRNPRYHAEPEVFGFSAAVLGRRKGRREMPTIAAWISLPATEQRREVDRWIERDFLHGTEIDVQFGNSFSDRIEVLV
jgi:hypothetical protein